MSPFYIGKKVKSEILKLANGIFPYVFPDICIVCKKEIENILCSECETIFNNEAGTKSSIWINNSNSIALKLLKAWKFNYSTRAKELLLSSLEKKIYLDDGSIHSKNSNAEKKYFANDIDLIVPVPLHKRKYCERGFNQSETIAHSISTILNAEVSNAIKRTKYTTPQSQVKTKKDRIGRLEGVFKCMTDLSGKRILLVDDVLTTGETTGECKKELLRAGAESVEVFALFSD